MGCTWERICLGSFTASALGNACDSELREAQSETSPFPSATRERGGGRRKDKDAKLLASSFALSPAVQFDSLRSLSHPNHFMKRRKPLSSATRSGKEAAIKPAAKPKSQAGQDEITGSVAFRKATAEAESCVKDPKLLRRLFLDAIEKINHIPRGPFAETWPYLMAMIRLIRAYHQREYQDISSPNLHIVVAAIIYFVSPFDVIPDSVPIFGHIDDALVVRLALRSVGADLDIFMAWETCKV
jgi:uncharacterized membrane protein YkvA (DUF1232 family)